MSLLYPDDVYTIRLSRPLPRSLNIFSGRFSDFRFFLACAFPSLKKDSDIMQGCPRLQRRVRPGFAPGSLFIRSNSNSIQRTPENRRHFSQGRQGSQEGVLNSTLSYVFSHVAQCFFDFFLGEKEMYLFYA